jgi:N-acetylmuramoyl-L-alanine amidase
MAKLIRKELNQLATQRPGSNLKVHLTRTSDENIGLADRARVAKAKKANVFLSIHCNGFNGAVRGTETLIISKQNGNVNVEQDRALAQRIQTAMVTTLKRHDPAAFDRKVKDHQRLGVLKDVHLQNPNTNSKTRACLAELEFIDVPAVDSLLNTGPTAKTVRKDLARSMAEAIIDDLEANN